MTPLETVERIKVLRWLETSEGKAWSKRTFRMCYNSAFFSIKDDLDSTPMHAWTVRRNCAPEGRGRPLTNDEVSMYL